MPSAGFVMLVQNTMRLGALRALRHQGNLWMGHRQRGKKRKLRTSSNGSKFASKLRLVSYQLELVGEKEWSQGSEHQSKHLITMDEHMQKSLLGWRKDAFWWPEHQFLMAMGRQQVPNIPQGQIWNITDCGFWGLDSRPIVSHNRSQYISQSPIQ